ncbi:MAG: hypothetical protein IRZ33_05310 [Alicyclobacillaceae bacterium]|nr:hypothetical protein [Alicyclobacillaceae bacterium]
MKPTFASSASPGASTYWRTLLELARRPRAAVEGNLDIPLPAAFRRARHMAAWSACCLLAAVLVRTGQPLALWWSRRLAFPAAWPTAVAETVAAALATSAAWAVSSAALYGILRLYTLVAHTMAIHIFQAQGRRLRLLNVEATILPLSAPAALGIALLRVSAPVGWVLIGCTAAWSGALLAWGHNVVFHRRGLGGFRLWAGSGLLAAFVLCVGLLAVMAAVGVIGLFAAAAVRSFVHRP